MLSEDPVTGEGEQTFVCPLVRFGGDDAVGDLV